MIPYVMLYTAVVGVPILLAALALAAVLRSYGRPERAVWIAALVLTFALPSMSLLDPVRSLPAAEPAPVVSMIGLPEIVALPVQQSSLDLGRLLVSLWVATSLVMALRWMVATLRLSWTSRSWHAGTLDGVEVLMTKDVGPAVSGVLRPRILAPAWLADLPARERALVLMHEQEHVRARDPILVSVARAARILTPWNPVVWVLTSRLVRALELDCDRRVLKRSADVAGYGHTLLSVSARKPSRLLAAAAFAESEAPLRNRILAMTTPPRTVSIVAIAAATVLGVVLLVGALGIPVPAMSLNVQIGSTPDQTPSVAVFDAPPTPPPPPPPAVEVPDPRVVVRSLVSRQGQLVVIRTPDGEIPAPAAPPAPPVGEPEFTPMTVRPQLQNMEEVNQALMRVYPAVLRDAGIGGAPVLWIHVNESGVVDATRVHTSSGFEALDEAARDVARTMQFSPAYNGDQIVGTWVQIPIRFQVVR
jgi:TonB family protein